MQAYATGRHKLGTGATSARRSLASAAFLLANLALCAGAAAYVAVRLLHRLAPDAEAARLFSPELFSEERTYTVAQLWMHRVALVCAGAFAAAGALAGGARVRQWMANRWLRGAGLAAVAAVWAAEAGLLLGTRHFHITRLTVAAMVLCGGALAAPAVTRFRRTACAAWAGLLIAIYLGIGLATPHTILLPERISMLAVVENHYSMVCGTAGRIAAGMHPFEDFRVWYGVALPVAVAALERAWGRFDLGGYMRAVQWLQVIFCVMACVAWRLWRPRDPRTLLYGLALTLPWINTAGRPGVVYPNHSAWRNMIFVLAPLAMVALRRARPARRACAVGAVVAAGLLLNTETGVAAALGLVAFLFLADAAEPPGRRVRYAACAALGAAAFFAVFELAGHALVGAWPVPATVLRPATGGGFGQGLFAGRSFTYGIELVAGFGIFLHAATVLIGCGMRYRTRRISPEGSVTGALAATILVWLAYFFNRPEDYYLWTILFCYTFLLYQLREAVGTRRAGRREVRYAAAAFAFCVLLPYGVVSNAEALHEVGTRLAGMRDATAREWAGIRLPAQTAGALIEKTGYLRRQPPGTLYLTANAVTMAQLSGNYPRLPFQDPFGETLLKADYNELLGKIRRSAAERLLMDTDDSPFYVSPQHRQMFARMRRDLETDYQRVATAAGWDIWERRQSPHAY